MVFIGSGAPCWHGICGTLHDYAFHGAPCDQAQFRNRDFYCSKWLFAGQSLYSSEDAKALTIGDSHPLGFRWPGIQKKKNNQDKALYVNHLIGMALGTIEVAHGEVYFRSSHGFESLPAAAWAHNGGGSAINLGHT